MAALNARQEQFAQLVASGEPPTGAYAAAFGGSKSPAVLAAATSRLLNSVKVQLRINRLRDKAAGLTAKALAKAETKAVLSIADKRAFLRDVVETAVGDVNERSRLAQSVKYGKDGEKEIKVPDKLSAIRLDAQLAGELDRPEQTGGLVSIQILNANFPLKADEKVVGSAASDVPRIDSKD